MADESTTAVAEQPTTETPPTEQPTTETPPTDDKGVTIKVTEEGLLVSGMKHAQEQDGEKKPAAERNPDGTFKKKEAERPDYLAEKFKTVEEQAQAYVELEKQYGTLKRDKEAGTGTAPEAVEDYTKEFKFEDLEALSPKMAGITAEDPLVASFAQAAHEEGIGTEQMQRLLTKTLTHLHPLLPEPFDANAEKAKLGPRADQLIEQTGRWIEMMLKTKQLTEEQVEALKVVGMTADGISALNVLRENAGQPPLPTTGQAPGQGDSRAEWEKRLNDPRMETDLDFRAATHEMGKRLFGEDPA